MLARPGVITNMDLAEEQIIFYRDHQDIFIEDAFPPIRLTRDQHVIAREFGRCSDVRIVQNRGAGKSWLTAVCCHAVACLYPGSLVAVCSGTAVQATIVLAKLKSIAEQNPNVANELKANSSRTIVQQQKDKGVASYKNGSRIESFSLTTMRGQRAKIVVIDEAPEVSREEQEAITAPVKNFRRELSFNFNFKDFPSKTVNITSACEKSNSFYEDFMRVVKDMAKGKKESFACALDYKASAANGIGEIEFYEKERERMPSLLFDMEYGSKFVGATNNSAFPYELIQSCRTQKTIELEQPKNSKSRYVICLDIATSEAKDADNSVQCVIKFTERTDGSFARKLVYIRSFHGKALDILAEEVRKLYHVYFPNTECIIYDARGLGDSLDRFFDKDWQDMNGKEYPPLVFDNNFSSPANAQRVLHPFRAVQALNQRIYSNLRVALEQKMIELPISSRVMSAEESLKEANERKLTMEEKAIYLEADALQLEMSNIVAKVSGSGNILYDTPRATMHKDRYSALAMGNDYISELEKENMKKYRTGEACVGFASNF